MNDPIFDLAPPHLDGVTWRAVGPDDLAALVELAGVVRAADGGLGFLFVSEVLASRYFPDAPGAAVGAFDAEGRLAACASVHLDGEARARRALIAGQVRPDQRRRGIGTYLMRWSVAQARSLLADAAADQPVMQLTTESQTDAGVQLYRAHGFDPVMESLVMERDLRLPLPEMALPQRVTLTTWQPEVAEQFFAAYYDAFHDRPGFPGWSAAEWIAQVIDNDLMPEWTLLACAEGAPLGFVVGNADLTTHPTGGYVWQIGVVPTYRRRGLASLLLVETMRRMQAAGAHPALLTVHTDNPGAIETYARLGFTTIGRRARYERAA